MAGSCPKNETYLVFFKTSVGGTMYTLLAEKKNETYLVLLEEVKYLNPGASVQKNINLTPISAPFGPKERDLSRFMVKVKENCLDFPQRPLIV